MTKKQEAEQKRAEKLRLERERIEGMKVYERAHPDCRLICGDLVGYEGK